MELSRTLEPALGHFNELPARKDDDFLSASWPVKKGSSFNREIEYPAGAFLFVPV